MARKVVWTKRAKRELHEILLYWAERNKPKTFSLKLNDLINRQIKLIQSFPESGRLTDIQNVRLSVIVEYLLYYEFINDTIYILTIRHNKRNPEWLDVN
jgi:toxin YoeB